MSIAALNFKDLAIPEQVLKTRDIINRTKDNTDFPHPIPSIADITASNDLLELCHSDASGRDHQFVSIMERQEKKHYALMMLFVGFVQDKSGGDKLKIESTGLDVKKRGGKGKKLASVSYLRQLIWGIEGEVRMRWKLLKGARSFVSQTSNNWKNRWRYTDFASTKATLVIGKLVSESYVWVRIAGINSMGIGAWSNPVRVKVK